MVHAIRGYSHPIVERYGRGILKTLPIEHRYDTQSPPNAKPFSNFDKTFEEYVQHWRELAARVQPLLLVRELVDMFMGNLQGPYLDIMVRSTSLGFSDLVLAGERI